MRHHTAQLYGKTPGALAGLIGSIKDVHFDDRTWDVRYLAVNLGSWLAEGLVLLSPQALLAPPVGNYSSQLEAGNAQESSTA